MSSHRPDAPLISDIRQTKGFARLLRTATSSGDRFTEFTPNRTTGDITKWRRLLYLRELGDSYDWALYYPSGGVLTNPPVTEEDSIGGAVFARYEPLKGLYLLERLLQRSSYGSTDTSDASGRYRITSTPPGPFTFSFQRADGAGQGYFGGLRNHPPSSTNEVSKLKQDIYLPPGMGLEVWGIPPRLGIPDGVDTPPNYPIGKVPVGNGFNRLPTFKVATKYRNEGRAGGALYDRIVGTQVDYYLLEQPFHGQVIELPVHDHLYFNQTVPVGSYYVETDFINPDRTLRRVNIQQHDLDGERNHTGIEVWRKLS